MKVPQFDETFLQLNDYKLYQKSYSPWKIQCQAKYTTRQVA